MTKLNREQILALAKSEAEKTIDCDLLGNPITDADVILMGAYGPLVIRIVNAAIASYKAELLKEVGEPVAFLRFWASQYYAGYGDIEFDEGFEVTRDKEPGVDGSTAFAVFTSDQVAAAVLKATKSLDKPIDPSLAAEIERTDWTPAEALQFYADQRNFDIVGGHARIIDNGAVASNALKHLSIDRLELKGDAELAELRAQLAAAQEEIEELKARCSERDYFANQNFTLRDQLATAEQRVAEWQPIETAPKDGTGFLAAEATKSPFVALWLDADHPDVDEAGWYDHWNFDPVSPTHWMPLPKAPANTASS